MLGESEDRHWGQGVLGRDGRDLGQAGRLGARGGELGISRVPLMSFSGATKILVSFYRHLQTFVYLDLYFCMPLVFL